LSGPRTVAIGKIRRKRELRARHKETLGGSKEERRKRRENIHKKNRRAGRKGKNEDIVQQRNLLLQVRGRGDYNKNQS
jgi:hypothetical protein